MKVGYPSELLKRLEPLAEEFLDIITGSEPATEGEYYEILFTYINKRLLDFQKEIPGQCPDCRNESLFWQRTNHINTVICRYCGVVREGRKAEVVLRRYGLLSTDFPTQQRPTGTHIRLRPTVDAFKAVRKALAMLTMNKEKDYGTVTNPYEDMSVILSKNKFGVFSSSCRGFETKTLARALHDRENVNYTNDYIIIDFFDKVLYVNYSPKGWITFHPYLNPQVYTNLK